MVYRERETPASADGRLLRPLLEPDDAMLARFAFVSVRGAARCLAMHPNSVLRLIRAGIIPAAKVRERWYVPLSFLVQLEAEAYQRVRDVPGSLSCRAGARGRP